MAFGYVPPHNWVWQPKVMWTELTLWFLGQDNLLKRSHVGEAFRLLNLRATDTVLEVGAGGLNYASEIAKKCKSIIALDYYDGFTDLPKWRRYPDNLTAVRGDAQTLDFESGTFDVVFMSEVLPVLDRPDECVREIYRVLKPGGRVVIVNGRLFELLEDMFDDPRLIKILERSNSRWGTPITFKEFREFFVNYHGTKSDFHVRRNELVEGWVRSAGFRDIEQSWMLGDRSQRFYIGKLISKLSKTGVPELGRGQVLNLPILKLLNALDDTHSDGQTHFCSARKPG